MLVTIVFHIPKQQGGPYNVVHINSLTFSWFDCYYIGNIHSSNIFFNNDFEGLFNICRMFYLFFESRNKKKDPVVIWLTGGPGCGSEMALFFENGPFHITNNLSLEWNNYGWDMVCTEYIIQ